MHDVDVTLSGCFNERSVDLSDISVNADLLLPDEVLLQSLLFALFCIDPITILDCETDLDLDLGHDLRLLTARDKLVSRVLLGILYDSHLFECEWCPETVYLGHVLDL
jgi:hypothetical protein